MTALQPKNESLWQIEETLENLVQLRAQAEAEGDSEALKAIDAETEKYLDKQPAKVDSYCALIRRNGSAADECEKEGVEERRTAPQGYSLARDAEFRRARTRKQDEPAQSAG